MGIVIIGVLIWLDLILRKADKEILKRHFVIESQGKKLEETKASLEIRIKGRTGELQELAQKLEQQIRERTKQLQEKLAELQKFNRLAVGRELKMIELKEEITKLKEQLQNKKHDSK
jgi:C4-dicarboxylate-specific signal transduction histidine kinase